MVAETGSTGTRHPTDERLNQALDSWPLWACGLTRRPEVVRQLGGNSNETYLLNCDEISIVVRLNAEANPPGVNRIAEQWALEQQAISDFTAEVLHWHSDFIVTAYEPGQQFDMAINEQQLPEVVKLMGRIHNLVPPDMPRLEPFSHLENYLADPLVTSTKLLAACENKVKGLKPRRLNYRICHNDLNPENILVTPTGMVILDWEYANITPAEFEMAVFICSHGLNFSQLELLVTHYDGEIVIESVTAYQRLYQLLEILWWQIKKPDQKKFDQALEQLMFKTDG